MMESLQIAQILADLSDLQNTDPAAATALLSAKPPTLRSQTLTASVNEPVKFDRLGRRIVGPVRRTPPLSRANSTMTSSTSSLGGVVGSNASSGAATPCASEKAVTDEDMKRARTLLEFFEMRGKFKQMGDTGLLRSKERVDAVAARYAKRDSEERDRAMRSKYLSPSPRV